MTKHSFQVIFEALVILVFIGLCNGTANIFLWSDLSKIVVVVILLLAAYSISTEGEGGDNEQ